jgi:hypothetical protein
VRFFPADFRGADAGFVNLALECLANPAMPLRRMAVLFRNPGEADPQMRELWETLNSACQCNVGEFRGQQDLEARVEEILAGWYSEVSAPGNPDRSE